MNTSSPNLNSCAVDVETLIKDVDTLELDSYAGRYKLLGDELHAKQDGRQLTKEGKEDIEGDIVAVEIAERVKPQTKVINLASGGTETVRLAHSYTLVRNLVRIDQHPIHKKALAEWESEGLEEEIYSVIGFYSVFQGVLLTATSQSNYLHCLNVGVPIALSAFTSVHLPWLDSPYLC